MPDHGTPASERLFLLGIDGLPAKIFDRFLAEGILPNCARLCAASARLDVIPTLPPLTAPGWATIASGAHPATHGVANILQPLRDAAPDAIANGFDRSLVQAEYLWDVLSDNDKLGVVVKYPSSWPPRPGSFLQVDGAGGFADITCAFDALDSAAYVCSAERAPPRQAPAPVVPDGYKEHWRIDAGDSEGQIPVTPRAPLDWEGLRDDERACFEVVLPVQPTGVRGRSVLHGLAYLKDGQARLAISRDKSLTGALATLKVGDWSDWIQDGPPDQAFAYRVKLMALDVENRAFRLYRSSGHRLSGFTQPASLAGELVAAVGPVCEWTGTFDTMNGLVDLATQLEIYDQHTDWMERLIRHLAREPWHGFFMQWHVVEYAHHIGGAALSDEHPAADEDREAYLELIRGAYRLMDRLVGTVLECAGPQAAVALVSDHGHDVVHTLFFANEFLRRNGWLEVRSTPEGEEIDWSRTRAYATYPGSIHVNTRSRWTGGIVEAEEVEALCADIDAALRGLVDDRLDKPLVNGVIRRAEMAAFGQGGLAAPDLSFTLRSGYETASRLCAGGPLLEATRPGVEVTSGHGSFHPFTPEARTMALLRSAQVRGGVQARYPVPITDLAPTFAALMGVPPPREADGRAMNFAQLDIAVLAEAAA